MQLNLEMAIPELAHFLILHFKAPKSRRHLVGRSGLEVAGGLGSIASWLRVSGGFLALRVYGLGFGGGQKGLRV